MGKIKAPKPKQETHWGRRREVRMAVASVREMLKVKGQATSLHDRQAGQPRLLIQ